MPAEDKKKEPFLQDYQKKNILTLLRNSIEKVITQWLPTDEEDSTKMKMLQQVAEADIETNELSESSLPEYLKRLWANPNQVIKNFDNYSSIKEIRTLIKVTVKDFELIHIHQKSP